MHDEIVDKLKKYFPNISSTEQTRLQERMADLISFIKDNEEHLIMATKLALSDDKEVYHYRNLMAESGYECTPSDIREYNNIIRIILESL
jgi:hypothetical protein